MSKESRLSHSELVWLERETIKTYKNVTCIIVYYNDVIDFAIQITVPILLVGKEKKGKKKWVTLLIWLLLFQKLEQFLSMSW